VEAEWVDHVGRSDPRWGEFTRLARGESLRLLATVPVGRLIFTVNALPTVRPVNFAVVAGLLLVRTAADSTTARTVDGTIVAFEADELDAATCSGWSVTVTGRAECQRQPKPDQLAALPRPVQFSVAADTLSSSPILAWPRGTGGCRCSRGRQGFVTGS
jgi:uncharacterized protein